MWSQSKADFQPIPGVLYVEFSGLPSFGQAGLSVTEVSEAFPDVGHLAAKRSLPIEALRLQSIYRVTYSDPISPEQAAARVERLPGVVYAEPIFPAQIDALPIPDDPLFAPNGTVEPYMDRLNMEEAWDVVKGEDGNVVIAINDSGMDWEHEDLRANVWTNSGETPDNGVDDDGNGYIDDVYGWNFGNNSNDPRPRLASDFHGTAVAGAAVAVTNNATGMAGSSWNARFMAVNILCETGSLSFCYGAEGIMYSAANGADIVNASYGSFWYSQTYLNVSQAALSMGTLVVAPSGNSRTNQRWVRANPAGYQQTLSVCGTENGSDVNALSYGYTVDVCAAGISVLVTLPGDRYGRADGTSFSAPLVSGIAALVKTRFPSYTPEQVREQIRATADNIDALNGSDYAGLLGRGRVNAQRAVTETDAVSVRMTDYTITDADGDGLLEEGERITVTATLRNYLSAISSWSLQWEADNSHITFVSGATGGGGGWASGADQTVRLVFRWDASMPYKTVTFIEPVVTVGGEVVTGSDAVRFVGNDAQVATHETSRFKFDITSEGNIGWVEYGFLPSWNYPGITGKGFYHVNPTWSIAHEAGILVGTASHRVSGSVFNNGLREVSSGFIQNTDFVPVTPLVFSTDGAGVQSSLVKMTDSNASSPLGLEISQESRVDVTNNDDDIALLRYTLYNPKSTAVNNVHIGIYSDWEITSGRTLWFENVAGYDSQEGITYIRDDRPATDYIGFLPLTDDITRHSRSYDHPSSVLVRPTDVWSGLSGGVVTPTAEVRNWSQLIALGPYAMPSSSRVEAGFAMIYGSSMEDLRANARRAKAMYDAWPRSFVQRPDSPNAPTVTAADASLEVEWTAPADNGAAITGYAVRYCEGTATCDDADWTDHSVSGTGLTTTITGLTNGTTYQVQVNATNAVGTSDWSDSATGMPVTSLLAPDAPLPPTVTAGNAVLGVSWTAPNANGSAITGYGVRYCEGTATCDDADWTDHSVSGTGLTTTITGLTNGTTYQVQVNATNAVGTSDWSDSATGMPVTSLLAPDAPLPPTVTAGNAVLGVSWTAPNANGSAITGYGVRYCEGTATCDDADWTDHSVSGTGLTTTITGLTNGTTYQVQVNATNAVGTSDWSDSATGMPVTSLLAPDAPLPPTVTAGNAVLGVSWTAPNANGSAITGYGVRYCEGTATCDDADWTDHSVSGTGLTTTITGLTNGTTYQVQVRATNGVGTSDWSASGTGTPAGQPPAAPTALEVSVDSGALSLRWAPSVENGAPVTGYEAFWRTGSEDYSSDNVMVSGTTATITELTNGTLYEVRVRAQSDVGASPYSMIQATPAAVALAEHSTTSVSVTITGEGNLGHTVVQGDFASKGVGFVVTTADGQRRDILFEGGLMVATSETDIADAVREGPMGVQEEDFDLQDETTLELDMPGERVASESRVHMTDGMGLKVYQESYIDTEAGNEDFLILRYVAASDAGANTHIGLFLDWNIASDTMDATGFDAVRQTGYVMDDPMNPTVVVGTRVLSVNGHETSLHYSAIDNAAVLGDADGFTPAEKWNLISGGVQSGEVMNRDVSQLIGVGPFDLRQRPAEVVIAVVYGTSVADFQRNADRALELWESTISRSLTHNTPALTASITETGGFGYAFERDIAPTLEDGLWSGQGFVAQTATGGSKQLIGPQVASASGVVVATSASQMSDVLPEAAPGTYDHAVEQDFVRAPNTVLAISSLGTSQEGLVRMTDSASDNPLGVTLVQRSLVDEMMENEDFMILRNAIHNSSGSRIEDLYAGLVIDWGANVSYSEDYTGFDVTRQVGYVLDAEPGNETVVSGTRLLSDGMLHYRAATRFESYFANGEGLTAEKKWGFLTGGVNTTSLRETDVTQWTSMGPVTLEAGDSTVFAVAVVSGTSEDDFLTNADQALNLWQSITVSREEEADPRVRNANEWALSVPYPNPAVFPVQMRYEIPEQGQVQLTVYDLLGRRIRELVDAPHAQGEQTVAWDGLDDTGARVASGLYLIGITAEIGSQTIVETQPVMVVR